MTGDTGEVSRVLKANHNMCINYLSQQGIFAITNISLADSLGQYYMRFKKLVEGMHDNAGDVPVIILSHSMGSPVMSHFLAR